MKMPKTFDCIKFKEEMQARFLKEYEGLTDDEIRKRIRHKLATSQTPIAKLWRKLQARDEKKAKVEMSRTTHKRARKSRSPA